MIRRRTDGSTSITVREYEKCTGYYGDSLGLYEKWIFVTNPRYGYVISLQQQYHHYLEDPRYAKICNNALNKLINIGSEFRKLASQKIDVEIIEEYLTSRYSEKMCETLINRLNEASRYGLRK